jgi:type I restriction enzyme R subunit
MGAINRLLDGSIAADGFVIREDGTGHSATIDISAIDFAALAKRFPRSKQQKLELEQLKAAIRAQIGRMIQVNKTRTDYLVRFEELIESYNAGSRNIEDLFQELLNLTQALSEEQQRNVREQLSEEELTVFDILTRPGPELSAEERDEVKKVARALLERLKKAIVLDWRRRAQARAQVRLAIEDTLDEGLPAAYTPAIYEQKAAAVFEHVFESYPGGGASVSTRVA